MELEILSLSDALKFIPYKKTYSIRIFDSDVQLPLLFLRESKNWVFTKNYFFDDVWPEHWKEFLGEFDYLNAHGMHDSRNILFDENLARKILKDYEHLGRGQRVF
ncbi:MAG: hypothetical protein KKB62_00050 [Nanoarchaeota archaeon]|nr:hypothetical protein [Nanoarchaeota archaeon]